jgi:hypothetical protein
MWKSTIAFLLLLGLSSSFACFVTIDDVDMTDELFVEDDDSNGGGYLNCTGTYRCKNAIMSCETIRCEGNEACYAANVEFTDSVTCVGTHACHKANLTHTNTHESSRKKKPKVLCDGTLACDVAIISGPDQLRVTCLGAKGCRKAMITAHTIHCTQGSNLYPACMGYASLTSECLVCGLHGCSGHINECRYQTFSEEQEDDVRRHPCQPERLQGTCDPQQKEAFEQELIEQMIQHL